MGYTEWMKGRAEKEVDCVAKCKRTVTGQVSAMMGERSALAAEVEKQKARLLEKKAEGADKTTLRFLADEYQNIVSMLKDKDEEMSAKQQILNSLRQLENRVKTCMNNGWYRYVVRNIPEKKLASMINSENISDFIKLKELIEKIITKIQTRIEEITSVTDQYKEIRSVRDAEHEGIMSVSEEKKDAELDLLFEELGAEVAKVAPVVAPTPVTVTAAAETESTAANANHAN